MAAVSSLLPQFDSTERYKPSTEQSLYRYQQSKKPFLYDYRRAGLVHETVRDAQIGIITAHP
jgi:hypothetical protein